MTIEEAWLQERIKSFEPYQGIFFYELNNSSGKIYVNYHLSTYSFSPNIWKKKPLWWTLYCIFSCFVADYLLQIPPFKISYIFVTNIYREVVVYAAREKHLQNKKPKIVNKILTTKFYGKDYSDYTIFD